MSVRSENRQQPSGPQRITVLHVLVCAAATLVIILVASPVSAKLPEFGVTVEPTSPIAGELVIVTVKFGQPLPVEIEQMSALLAFYRTEDADSRTNGVPVSPTRVDETTYVGRVVIPEPGPWVLVSFPNRGGWSNPDEVPPGYPDRIPVEVKSSAGFAARVAKPFAAAGLVLIALVLLAARVFPSWRMATQSDPSEPA